MHVYEEFEDTKEVIRIRKSKDRQHKGHKRDNKDKQRSTKHTHKTKDRVLRTPLKIGSELRCTGRVSSSCSTSGTHLGNLLTNHVISFRRVKDREVLTTNGIYTTICLLFCACSEPGIGFSWNNVIVVISL